MQQKWLLLRFLHPNASNSLKIRNIAIIVLLPLVNDISYAGIANHKIANIFHKRSLSRGDTRWVKQRDTGLGLGLLMRCSKLGLGLLMRCLLGLGLNTLEQVALFKAKPSGFNKDKE